MHYKLDECVQEQVTDAVNVTCAASWRAFAGAEGSVKCLFVEFTNTGRFD